MRFKNQIVQVARRAAKSAAAAALHYSGAQDLISAVQRKAVGGARVLILSYHRVVGNLTLESERALPTLNIAQGTFRKHIEVLCETHDVVRLDDALDVLAGKRTARRDLAVITFDDGYRDVYDHAFPLLREMKLPAVAYVPSAFVGTPKRLAHDRLWCALKTMEKRGLGPMSVGVGGAFEALLLRSFDGAASAHDVLDRLISENATAVLYGLADALEDRLRIDRTEAPRGQLPMSWEMLREMAAHGIETGAHTAPIRRSTRRGARSQPARARSRKARGARCATSRTATAGTAPGSRRPFGPRGS